MENEDAFKHKFGRDLLVRMADSIQQVYPSFEHHRFIQLFPKLKGLEMKARVRFLRDELVKLLPSNYPQALAVLLDSTAAGKLRDFDLWIYTEYIQTCGLEHEAVSLEALKKLTTLFTSEWAVRPFLRRSPERTLKFLLACTTDKDERIRRWASEGSRPRLPWGERLHEFIARPESTLPILEALKFDDALFVRTSVANHLNDLAKDHPGQVLQLLKRWRTEAGKMHGLKIEWIIKRALRTLIKEGNPAALKLIGVDAEARIKVQDFTVAPKAITLGERLGFTLELVSLATTPQKLVVDYVIHFVKANGQTTPKVFKFKVLELPAGRTMRLQKTHHVKPVTTRRYYPGKNVLELQINGKSFGKKDWVLRSA